MGGTAFKDPSPVLAVIALLAFISSIGASVFILVPKRDRFTFSLSGPGLYEGLYEVRSDLAEVYRRLAYDLLAFGRPTTPACNLCSARPGSARSR